MFTWLRWPYFSSPREQNIKLSLGQRFRDAAYDADYRVWHGTFSLYQQPLHLGRVIDVIRATKLGSFIIPPIYVSCHRNP